MGVSHRGSCKIRMGASCLLPLGKEWHKLAGGRALGGKLGEAYGCMSQGSKDRG